MHLDQESLRLIFGIKLSTMRKKKGLSLKSLSHTTGLSPSYINEIEKGKKYPRGEKILLLAEALGSNYDELTSVKMKDELQNLSEILESSLIKGLPFEVFGLESRSLISLLSSTPVKSSALIGTIIEVARHHNIEVPSLFHATLRAYLDMNENYFEDIDKEAELFRKNELKKEDPELFKSSTKLKEYLEKKYGIKVIEKDFSDFPDAIQNLSYFVRKSRSKSQLYINSQSMKKKKQSILIQEIGYQHFQLKERRISPLESHLDSYEQLYNDFRTNYFATALIYPAKDFAEEIKDFFRNKEFDAKAFVEWMESYPGTYTMFFERLTQCLPKFLKLDEIFLLKVLHNKKSNTFKIDRELHLSSLHSPHRVEGDQHYCRRWLSCTLVDKIKKAKIPVAATQISNFTNTDNKYFCISAAWQQERNPDLQSCITLGIHFNTKASKAIAFADEDRTQKRIVCSTCEQCPILDCEERAAENSQYKKVSQEKEAAQFIVDGEIL